MVWVTIRDNPSEQRDPDAPPPQQTFAASARTFLDHACRLDVESAPAALRLTGIICTIGPSTADEEMLEKMMEEGMNVARVNCSFSPQESLLEIISNIRKAAAKYSKRLGTKYPVAIALDIKGPEIRLGYLESGKDAEIQLNKGDQIKLSTDKAYYEKGSASVMYIDYDNIQRVVQIGNRVYVDDGLITLICTNVQGSVITCVVENGGILGGGKSVNLPGVNIDLPVVSERDKSDLLFGVEQKVDIIFASYIREASAISEMRDIMGREGRNILVVSKIENQQGVHNIDEIIKVSDGIMVGRGDLGIELPIQKLFLAQKSIIAKCNRAGKPVICANQMLESMSMKPRPHRSEVTDVANAILDGADCVMLTTETAKGLYPLETIRMMSSVCKEAESALWYNQIFIELVDRVVPPLDTTHGIAIATVEAALKCKAAAIIVITTSGRSAYLIARYRPHCPILTVTRSEVTAAQCHLHRGLLPLVYPNERLPDWMEDVETRIRFAISFAKWKKFIRNGDPVIAIHGSKKGSGYTDTLKILYVTKPTIEGELCGCPDINKELFEVL